MAWHAHMDLQRQLSTAKSNLEDLRRRSDRLGKQIVASESRQEDLERRREVTLGDVEKDSRDANRPRRDFHASKVESLEKQIRDESSCEADSRRVLSAIQQELNQAMSSYAKLETEAAESGLTEAMERREGTQARKAEARRQGEVKRLAARDAAMSSGPGQGSGQQRGLQAQVSKLGTTAADKIAWRVASERQAVLDEEATVEQREAERQADNCDEFERNMEEQKRLLADYARMRADKQSVIDRQDELYYKGIKERGLNVASERQRQMRLTEKQSKQTSFMEAQRKAKKEQDQKLVRERARRRLEANVSQLPQWQDRTAIKISTYPRKEKTELPGYITDAQAAKVFGDDKVLLEGSGGERAGGRSTTSSTAFQADTTGHGKVQGRRDTKQIGGDLKDNTRAYSGLSTRPGQDELDAPGGTGRAIRMEKFEASQAARMALAYDRMKQYVPTVQVAGGRRYSGPGFGWKPSVVTFQDFDVDEEYGVLVTLTNISYTRNACKMIGTSPEISDFVDVDFSPPGMVSAGLTCTARIRFRPKMNQDLTGSVMFRSDTGPFFIPIHCRIKRRVVQCSTSVVDFGKMIVSESRAKVVSLESRGALDVPYVIDTVCLRDVASLAVELADEKQSAGSADERNASGTDGVSSGWTMPEGAGLSDVDEAVTAESQPSLFGGWTPVPDPDSLAENVVQVSQADRQGVIPARGKRDIHFTFCPTDSGDVKQYFRVALTDSNVEEIILESRSSVSQLPVYLDRDSVDLKICTFNFLYQDDVVLHNRTNASCSFSVDYPNDIKSHLDVLPQKGVVQANSTFALWIKFKPKKSLLTSDSRCFYKEAQSISVPVSIRINQLNQQLAFDVNAVVTNNDLRFDVGSFIDFGKCSVDVRTSVPVVVSNLGLSSQSYGFVGLPKNVQVQPGDGFGELLPGQSRSLDIVFSPDRPGSYNFTLNCQTLQGRVFSLDCTGKAFLSPFKLSRTVLDFRPTAIGETSSSSITIRHPILSPSSAIVLAGLAPKKGTRRFHIAIPENVPIEASPSTGELKPGEEMKVLLMFAPVLNKKAVEAMAKEIAENKAQATRQELKSSSKSLSVSSKSRMSNKSLTGSATRLPKPLTAREEEDNKSEYLNAAKHAMIRAQMPFQLKAGIRCYVSEVIHPGVESSVEPRMSDVHTLYFDTIMTTTAPACDFDVTAINFNALAAGSSALREAEVTNATNAPLKILPRAMDPFGPFVVAKAPREIPTGQGARFVVRFAPLEVGKFSDILEFSDGFGSSYRATVTGECVATSFKLVPEPVQNAVDFGNVLVGQKDRRQFEVCNHSSVPLDFEARLEPSDKSSTRGLPLTSAGQSVFSLRCTTQSGKLAAGEKISVTVEIVADRPALHLAAKLTIRVSTAVTVLDVLASVWQRPLCLVGDEPLNLVAWNGRVAGMPVLNAGSSSAAGKVEFPITLNLRFTHGGSDPADRTTSRHFSIQSLKPQGTGKDKKVYEFSFGAIEPTSLAPLVQIDPQKGACDRKVTITLTIPSLMELEDLIHMVVPLTLKSEGSEEITVALHSHRIAPRTPGGKEASAAKTSGGADDVDAVDAANPSSVL